ncbi:MAG: CotH kinase family protein [Oscillospiraceae bacterium]|nr:CotH kinase family protein [Oscillospiraceae bacterium]
MKKKILFSAVSLAVIALISAGVIFYESRYGYGNENENKKIEAADGADFEHSDYAGVDLKFIDGVRFAAEPGIYREGFVLFIEENDGAMRKYCENGERGETLIRYTTDGTVPAADSAEYDKNKGISIDKKTGTASGGASVNVIRAAAFDAKTGEMIGRAASGSYIYAESDDRFHCAVISLITDPDNFYGYENGIYVEGRLYDEWLEKPVNERYILPDANYVMRGKDWERPVHIEFFEPDGTTGFSQNAGIRIAGGLMRIAAQKSMKIFARAEYDPIKNNFEYDIFDGLRSNTGKPIDYFDSLMLRSASNDQAAALIRTPLVQTLAGHAGFDNAAYRAVSVFLNGEYFGMMALFEDNQDPGYYQHYYDIQKKEISMMNIRVSRSWNYNWELDNGPPEEYDNFMYMRDYIIKNDMSDPENYREASAMLDMENFAKYAAIQCYANNVDWPENNVRLWRRYTNGYDPKAVEYGYDGRWRFLLKDLDLTFGYNSDHASNPYPKATGDDGLGMRIGPMFAGVLKNEDFRTMYSNYICDLANAYFSPAEALAVLAGVELQCANEMQYHIPRWVNEYDYLGSPGAPDSLRTWNTHLRTIRKYIEARPQNIIARTRRFLKLEDDWTLSVKEPAHARVKINTVDLTRERYDNGLWRGQYFAFQGIPVSVACEPGWKIAGVEVTGGTLEDTDSPGEKILTLTGSAVLEISVVKDSGYTAEAKGVVINEIYNAPQGGDDWIELYNAGDKAVSLKNWCLSDDENKLFKWPIPGISLEPGEARIIYCTKQNQFDISGALHTNFKLKRGEIVYLFNSDNGEIVDSREVGDIKKRYSEGCFPDGERDNWIITARPTPGTKNRK